MSQILFSFFAQCGEKETLRGVFPEPTARALPRVCRIREIFSSVPPLLSLLPHTDRFSFASFSGVRGYWLNWFNCPDPCNIATFLFFPFYPCSIPAGTRFLLAFSVPDRFRLNFTPQL